MAQRLASFKAYDIRGRIPDELNADLVYRIARAYAAFLRPRRVVVGHDIRLTSPEFADAVAQGLVDSGVDVVHIGQVGTEQVYHAVFHLGLDGGIMVELGLRRDRLPRLPRLQARGAPGPLRRPVVSPLRGASPGRVRPGGRRGMDGDVGRPVHGEREQQSGR